MYTGDRTPFLSHWLLPFLF
uniref:Uncharacterized protein n=1 Tax=Arundo donax TaxID=35708 RepID=A0A0A8YL72_ARUDO